MPRRTAAFVMALISVTAAVYAVEVFCFFDPLELRGAQPPAGFDRRDWFEIVRDLRATGISAYPVLATATWLPSPLYVDGGPVIPLSGVPHAKTVMCNESGTYVTYDSDRFGFNAPDTQWERSPDVALVGDSMVEGWCVPREDSIGGIIRSVIPRTLNVGYTGHGPLAELGTLREYVAARRPGHVVWFFYEGNDLIRDLPTEMRSPILRRYLQPAFRQHLEERADPIAADMRQRFDARLNGSTPEAPVPAFETIAKLRSLRHLIGIGIAQAAAEPPQDEPVADLRVILAEAKRTTDGWGGSLHFVYLPDLDSVMNGRHSANRDRVLAVAAEVGLRVIDVSAELKDHPSPLSLFPLEEGRHLVKTKGLHYNGNGHRFIAQRILTVLQPMIGSGVDTTAAHANE